MVETTELDDILNIQTAQVDRASRPRKSTTEVDQRISTLLACCSVTSSRQTLMTCLNLKHIEHFRNKYLLPALEAGYIEMTIPQKPRSGKQMYHVSAKVRKWLQERNEEIGDAGEAE